MKDTYIAAFPKQKKKKHKILKNPKPTAEDRCIYCGTVYASLHEVFEGKNRQNSIKYHLQVRLCITCHKDVQEHPLCGRDLELKKEHQQKFIDDYGYKKWMIEFQRDYSYL